MTAIDLHFSMHILKNNTKVVEYRQFYRKLTCMELMEYGTNMELISKYTDCTATPAHHEVG